jgi:hypothetical protein
VTAVLGERVREAVENLIQASSESLEPVLQGPTPVGPKHIYVAATRIVMRMLVVLFAEARGMLPRENSLQELGGGLFRPGDPKSDDPVSRALACLEQHHAWIEGPVDFAALDTETLGTLYVGLLDRWDGTRKGSGTFYTPPQLARPTTRRTLQPLAYDAIEQRIDPETGLVEVIEWRVKTPEQILQLRVCDPAMGSGAFLLAALRYLSEALRESLLVHGHLGHEQLERAVAERCIYGVDLDPLAVELARLSLWIEIGDPQLPFDFLDHKLRCGNSLVGCWRDRFQDYPMLLIKARDAFDTWCALWFWPGDSLELAPTPQTLNAPSPETRRIVERLRQEHRFFHWELEFPHVFDTSGAGFHAIIGNPPWDIQKPSSKEFFSNVEPLYPSFGKQEALRWQTAAFERDPQLERDWIAYQARFKSLSTWVRSFRHQGSADLNSYKLFLEISHALTKVGGRLGLVVPSGLYTDKGTAQLRELLLERCRWEWLFGFENREDVFDTVDGRFKFAAVVAEKGGRTTVLRTAFMRRDLGDWDTPTPRALAYPRARVEQFSPKSKAILEVGSARDIEVLHKLYDNGVLLGDTGPRGWGIEYAREFDMTNDSKLFAPRPKWEHEGYRADEYGHWLKGGWKTYAGAKSVLRRDAGLVLSRDGKHAICVKDIEDVALPLYEGRMVGQFDFSEKGWVSGKGRTARWREIPLGAKVLEPQYLMARETARSVLEPKVAFMAIGSASNRRSMICSFVEALPAGNSLGVLRPRDSAAGGALMSALALTGCLNSFVFDAAFRCRLGGLNINRFILEEAPLPVFAFMGDGEGVQTARMVAKLSLASATFARSSLRARQDGLAGAHWRSGWASTRAEVLRVRAMTDAIVARWFGLDEQDMLHVLRECDAPQPARAADPKGFWRIDSEQPPELRHTVLSLVAFHDLQRMGLKAFVEQNDGEGWMLPNTLRLADYDLGHDDRAKQHQVVADVLGPRHFDWQLAQTAEQGWEECERHAELLEQILPLPAKQI